MCRSALPNWQRTEVLNIEETDGLQQMPFDAEFGLSFYDPYVSEPSLDLSPYLEDIDLDTNQQSEIFELVSTSPPKDQVKALQQGLLNTFLHESDYSYLVQENGAIYVECDDNASMSSQTVPNAFDLQSSGSSAPPSPQLPSDTRKLKSKRMRGRKSSLNKSRSVGKDTYEYRLKRERNNVAVRKSRMKTKEKHGEIFRKVNELTEENEELHATVASLTKELLRLKSYLNDSGLPNVGEL